MSTHEKSPACIESRTNTPIYDIHSLEESRLRNKLDKKVMPLVCLLWFCFLDRVNVGFASLAGLQKSLGLRGIQFNIGLTCFWLTYVIIETPSNLLGKHYGMGRWLAGCAIGFGICCMCSAFVRDFAQFCVVRALLGVFEGGMIPGIAFFLSKFYLGLVLASANVGAAFGGLIASGILTIDHIGWLIPWRNLVEGLITTVIAICVLFLIVDSPAQAGWLTEEEKMLAVRRLESEYPAVTKAAHRTRARTLRQGLFNINVSSGKFYAAVFLPTVVATLFPAKTAIESQLLSVPPQVEIYTIFTIVIPYISMRIDTRGPFMAVLAGVGVIGYSIFVGAKSLHARYAACFLVAAGAFPFGTFHPGLVAANTGPDATRAIALGVLSSVGYVGGIISTWTYVGSDAPDYRTGNTLNLVGMAVVFVLTVSTMIHMKWENACRDRGARDDRLDGLGPAEEAQLGHLHPRFRYKI
ncbi:major facilitator superfamily domain-containing protein [Mycena crocata]|nr:major facilitator superfamily domain-containing protein [Mycena crocata]